MEKVMGLFGGGDSAEKTAVTTGGGATTAALNTAQTPEQKEKAEKLKLIHGVAVPATIAVFAEYSYKNLNELLEKRNDKYVIKADQYDALLAALQEQQQDPSLDAQTKVKVEEKIKYLIEIGKNDEKNLIHQGMVEMGLDKHLEKNKEGDVVDDIVVYVEKLLNLGSVQFEKISDDPVKQQMLADYRRTGKPTLKECMEAGVFIFEIEDTSHTKAQIDEL